MDGQRIFKKKTNQHYERLKHCESFDTSDDITIVVDCNNWELKYYSNGEIIADNMSIEEDKTYHVVISMFYGKLSYKLVENPHIDL